MADQPHDPNKDYAPPGISNPTNDPESFPPPHSSPAAGGTPISVPADYLEKPAKNDGATAGK